MPSTHLEWSPTMTREEFMHYAADAAYMGDESLLEGYVKEVFAELESLRAERDAARAEAERFREALSEVSTWREDCHAHDEDMGHPLRDMDEDEIEKIAEYAKRAIAGGRR